MLDIVITFSRYQITQHSVTPIASVAVGNCVQQPPLTSASSTDHLPSRPHQFHAMDVLHKNGYDMSRALASLVPSSGPVLCRDEMEEWSASEANLFEEALEKYGKDFNDVRQDFVSRGGGEGVGLARWVKSRDPNLGLGCLHLGPLLIKN